MRAPLATVFLLAALPAAAQPALDGPVGFRGGVTEGAGLTAPGMVELELGGSVSRERGATALALGEAALFVGISPRLELRAHLNSWTRSSGPSGAVAGREDAALGAAIALLEGDGARPATTVMLHAELPFGSLPGRERHWRPGAKAALEWTLPWSATLAANVGVFGAVEGGERFLQRSAGVWLGRTLHPRVTGFAELHGVDRDAPAGVPATAAGGGVAILVTPSIHLDLNASATLGAARARAHALGVGVRQRW